VRLQAGILAEHEPIPAVRAFFEAVGHARVPRWASTAALDDELQRADLVLVLGGDVHMTPDALRGLVAVMQANPKIAALGPVANAAPDVQRIAPKYSDLDRDLRRFAERRAKKYAGIWHDAPALGAFCVLLRGEAVRTIGGLSRGVPIAEALAALFPRLRSAGLRVACAPGVYVHHAKWTPDEGALLEVSQAADQPLLESAPSGLV
jgi:GT2 family glycosyltransferase